MGEDRDNRQPSRQDLSRRAFLGALGAGTLGAAVIGEAEPAHEAAITRAGADVPATLLINGRQHRVLVKPRSTLLDVLRETLGLTGTKLGCARGECGACTVLIDGRPRYACLTLALEAERHGITTVEGLMDGEELGPVQQAFVEEDGFQCGYCTPGQVMAAEGLLRQNPNPDLAEIQEAMSGNLCRCGAYKHIVKAVQRAAELQAAAATSG
jgi:xanthine dehydrogenase YagT iron-sulfur-binding subunit